MGIISSIFDVPSVFPQKLSETGLSVVSVTRNDNALRDGNGELRYTIYVQWLRGIT